MPTSIASAVVIALAIVPGAFGNYTWRLFAGVDWREKEWQAAIRYLAFSVMGLGVYSLLASIVGFPAAVHALPETYSAPRLTVTALPTIFLAYLGHMLTSGVIGAITAFLHRITAWLRGASPQPSTWDAFITRSLSGRWVVASLKSGDIYAGIAEIAEESAPANERDLVLGYPARFEQETGEYRTTSYRTLFLPAELIQSVGALRLANEVRSYGGIGTSLFPSDLDEQRIESSSAGEAAL